MRSSRPYSAIIRSNFRAHKSKSTRKRIPILALLFLLGITLLPSDTFAARQRAGSSALAPMPLVTGADLALAPSAFQNDNVKDATETKEKSFPNTLTIPSGSRSATFTSDPTKAPIDFSDLAPCWSADTPSGTAVYVEIRTGPDGATWDPWTPAEEEDVLSPQDVPTRTYAGLIPVNQKQRTHRYVQSRVRLETDKPGVSPTLRELGYSFINAGVTPRALKPQAMIMGTPSEIPKPALVPRVEWGSPEGKSSPRWTPRFKRVTHIVIHHTATSNADTDFAARVRAIWHFHSKTRGWGDIGYNYLIDPNGVIYEGRAGGDDVEAGHAYPFNNGTMGIGIVGNYMSVAPSAAAQAALIDLLSWKADQRGIDPLGEATIKGRTDCDGTVVMERPTISGHRDFKGNACGRKFNGSTCPGDALYDMLPQIRRAVIAEQPPLRAVFTQHDTPGNIKPGETVDVHLTVRNSGSLTWPTTGQGAVSLGYRWLTPEGQPLKDGWQDLKTTLPKDVAFADTVTMTAKLNAPTIPGHYAVIWDMVRDGQGWFADQGSRPLRVDVVVGTKIGDTVKPESSVLPLPVYSSNPEVVVRWAGKDDPKGAGIASFDIQYRIIPQGPWSDWKAATAETEAVLEGLDGYTYGFRSRARDSAGNVEEWRDEPDAFTTVDTHPPLLSVDTPLNGAYVEPGRLLVRGRTEPGAFVAVNNTRAEEARGVFTSTVEASGRDYPIHLTAADSAGNVARLEVTVQAAARYNDVPMSHPAFHAVEYLTDQGVVAGYGDATFRPDTAVTRAQLAKTFAAALHWGLINPVEPRFSDVPPDSWMYPYVETAAARKAMDGYLDGTFRPNLNITRAQAMKVLVLAAGWKLEVPRSNHFLDVTPRHRLYVYVETAYSHGVIAPDDDGLFYPETPATRGFTSMAVYELMQTLLIENPILPDDDPTPPKP